METMERPEQTTDETTRHDRQPLALVLIAIVALLLGGLGGWLMWGADDGATEEVIEVTSGELTDRQQEMLRTIEELDAAVQSGTADAALVERLFVPQGIYSTRDTEYRVDDGSLATHFERGSDTSAALHPAALVADDVAVRLGSYGGTYSQTFRFTPSGEVLIIWAHIQN
ncbi:MAG: hypothetical protein ACR2O6_01550 [Ilumatobacteraceae bacterium]